MKTASRVGDYVEWNPEAAHLQGTFKEKLISATLFKGYTARDSKEEPQHSVRSDRTDHLTMHKRSLLKKPKGRR